MYVIARYAAFKSAAAPEILPMSLSPLRQNQLPADVASSSQLPMGSPRTDSPLTLSQALTITAGMAGLIGLLSGSVIRFSLANSPNARFLSPLQTFPVVSNSTSDSSTNKPDSNGVNPATRAGDSLLERNTSESWQQPDELDWPTDNSDFETFSSEGFTDTESTTELGFPDEPVSVPILESTLEESTLEKESVLESNIVPNTFDAFANRAQTQRRFETEEDPLKVLSNGPMLGQPDLTPSSINTFPQDADTENFETGLDESTSDSSAYDELDSWDDYPELYDSIESR